MVTNKGLSWKVLALVTAMLPNWSFGNVQRQEANADLSANIESDYVRQGFEYFAEAEKPRQTQEEQGLLYAKARQAFNAALQRNQNDFDAMVGLGKTNKSQSNCRDAAYWLEKAVNQGMANRTEIEDTILEDAIERLGYAYICEGKYARAEQCTAKLLGMNLEKSYKQEGFIKYQQAENQFHNGVLHRSDARKLYLEAIKKMNEALAFDANDFEVLGNIGAAYERLGELEKDKNDFATAEKYLQKSIVINSDSAPLHFTLGMVFEQEKKIDKAGDEYRKAAELCPAAINYKEKSRSIKKIK